MWLFVKECCRALVNFVTYPFRLIASQLFPASPIVEQNSLENPSFRHQPILLPPSSQSNNSILVVDKEAIQPPQSNNFDSDWMIANSDNLSLTHPFQHTLFGYLDINEASKLGTASKQFDAIAPYHEAAVKVLLQHTAKADEIAAEEIVRFNNSLILSKNTFTEDWCGQRHWTTPISALQYAAWAGDTDMVNMFLKHVPDDLKHEALNQLKAIKEHGTQYGEHLSAIRTLQQAYKEFADCDDRKFFSGEQLYQSFAEPWKKVGLNQLHSVVNLLQWFCSRIPFTYYSFSTPGTPSFTQPLPKARQLLLHSGNQLDLTSSSTLGVSDTLYVYANSGVYLSSNGEDARATIRGHFMCAERPVDEALNRFCWVRTEDLIKQIAQLEADTRKQHERRTSSFAK
jgi:hypothetical protein